MTATAPTWRRAVAWPDRAAVSVRLLLASSADAWAEQIGSVAAAVFAEPPWCEPPAVSRQLLDRLLLDSGTPGFRCATAEVDGALAGFGWRRAGWSLANRAGQPVGGPAPVELCELAVDPRWRGFRIGAALHDLLLAGATAPAWLATHPAACPALALYRSRGWQAARLLTYPREGTTRLVMHKRLVTPKSP